MKVMVQFERRDPFPLINEFSRSEALDHADACDQWLGFRVTEIEERLRLRGAGAKPSRAGGREQNLWFGLEPRDLQTPYLEIRSLLESIGHFESVIDLGAAYARMAFVLERHFKHARFTGFEYVGERVLAAREALVRFGASRSTVEHADLTSTDFVMPLADVYFIYDYGTPAAIEKTLHDLRRACAGRAAVVIARGRLCRYAIESRHSHWLAKPAGPERAVTIYSTLESALSFSGVEASV